MGLLKLFPLDFKKSGQKNICWLSPAPLNFSKRGVQPKNATSGLHDSKMCKNWLEPATNLCLELCVYRIMQFSSKSICTSILSRYFLCEISPQFGIYCKKEGNRHFLVNC